MTHVILLFLTTIVTCALAYYAILRLLSLAGLVPSDWFDWQIDHPSSARVPFLDWLKLKDYDRNKQRSTELAVRHLRRSRGNVAIQYGQFLSEIDLRSLSSSGDTAVQHIENAGRAP